MSLYIEKIAQMGNKVKKFIVKARKRQLPFCAKCHLFSAGISAEETRVILHFSAFQGDKDTALYRTAFFFALVFVKKEKI